jgi:hypothetical protein
LADGFYIINGTFTDRSSSAGLHDPNFHGDPQLTINGGIVTYGGANMKRVNASSAQPSEQIIYNPNIANLLPVLGESYYTWTEQAP